MSQHPTLVTTRPEDGIAVITLDSPANRNALSTALLTQLTDAVNEAGADESVLAILLNSSQRVFCAGADLKEAASVDMIEQARRIITVQRAIVAAPVPVVCRLDGPVRAGGLGLVASADLVVAAESVTFALTEVRLGLAAATISIPLRAKLEPRIAADWFLTGRQFTADEARAGGLVTTVAPEADMDDTVAGILADLRLGHRQGLSAAKELLTADLLADLDARGEEMARLSGLLFHSDVAQQRMAAALRR
jgi:enoyl-CoA hydratase/methylglutaconyl-CoA hydratase